MSYNDLNQSGVYTNGDTGLGGVTLQFYTDPNGDGDPSDGTLVQITTTDGEWLLRIVELEPRPLCRRGDRPAGLRQQRAGQQPARPQPHDADGQHEQ